MTSNVTSRDSFSPADSFQEDRSLPLENWMPFEKAMRRESTLTAAAADQQQSTEKLLPFAPKMIILPLEASSNEAHVEQLLSIAGSKTQYIKLNTAILIQRHAKSHQMETVENHSQEDVVPLDNVYMAQVLICFPEKKESSESQRRIQEDWLREVETLFKKGDDDSTKTTAATPPSTTTTGGDDTNRSEGDNRRRIFFDFSTHAQKIPNRNNNNFFDFPCFTGSYHSYKLPHTLVKGRKDGTFRIVAATWETSCFSILIHWKYTIAPVWCFGTLQMMCNDGSNLRRAYKGRKMGPHLHPITRLDPGAFCHLLNDDDKRSLQSKNASEDQDVWSVVTSVEPKYRKSMMLTEAQLHELDDSMDFETLEKVALLNPERGSSSTVDSGAKEAQKGDHEKRRSLVSVLVLSQNKANPQRRMFLSPGLGLTAQVSPSKLHRFSTTSISDLRDSDSAQEKNSEKYFRQHPFSSLARNTFFSISDREAHILVKFIANFPQNVALCLSMYSSMMWYQRQPAVVANKDEDFVSSSSYAPDFVWTNRLTRDVVALQPSIRKIYFTPDRTDTEKIYLSPTFTPDYYQGGRGFDRFLWMQRSCDRDLQCICKIDKPGGFNALISVLSFIPIPTLQRSVLGYSNSSDIVLKLWTAAVDEDHMQGFRMLVQHLHLVWSKDQRQQLAQELRDLISRCILRGSLQVLAALLDICFSPDDELFIHHAGVEVEFDPTDIFRSIWVNDDGKSFKLLGRKVPRFAAKYLKPEHFWLAVRCGSVKIVSFLIKMGAKVDLWSKKYGYLIESASNPGVLRLLLQAGAKPTLFVEKPTRSWWSLSFTDRESRMGPTKLPLSTLVKSLCSISVALKHRDPPVDPHTVVGISAFATQEWLDHSSLVNHLVPSQLVDRRDEFLCWQREQKLECFKVLEEFGVSISDCVQAVVEDIGNPIGMVCRSEYCSSKDHELIKFLAEKGGIGIQQVQDGVPKRRPFVVEDEVISRGIVCEPLSSTTTSSRDPEVIKFLAEKDGKGGIQHHPSLARESLLHCACRGDLKKKTILTLLELGAEKNTLNKRGESPYDVCARYEGINYVEKEKLRELKFLKSQGFISALQYYTRCKPAGVTLVHMVELTGQSLPVVHAALQAFDGDPRVALVSIVVTLMIDEKGEEESLGIQSMGSLAVSKTVKEEYLPQVRALNSTLENIYEAVRPFGQLDSPQSWLDAYEKLKEEANKDFSCSRGTVLENTTSEDEEESDDDDDKEDKDIKGSPQTVLEEIKRSF